jgi:aminoglycoside phosphotransferase (APT) family kinase protein
LCGSSQPRAHPLHHRGRSRARNVANGLEVSLWQWLEPVPFDVSPAQFGALLGDLHTALARYEADLPLLVGPLTDITSALRTQTDPALHEAAEWLLPLTSTWPRRPLHGDMHTGNLLKSDGLRWIDFEDVCVGPLEWDLASRTITDELVDGYPGDVNRAMLEDCRNLRRLQILAAVLTDDIQDAALYDELVGELSRRRR